MSIRVIENGNAFGIDLNEIMCINKSREIVDKDFIKSKLKISNESVDIINNGDYHRIENFSIDSSVDCWEVVSKDKTEVLITINRELLNSRRNFKRIKLKGLNEDAIYKNKETNEVFYGGALMNIGVNIKKLWEGFSGNIIHLKAI